mmetsp:Transcript_26542/g.40748  ORF Transcript_26542/g.40748 Transcript_26542/m.40748 type:complete len:376 (+) Transcript_26542:1-1128(+)
MVSERLVQKWKTNCQDGTPVEVTSELFKVAMDMISLIAYGQDLDTLRNEQNIVKKDVSTMFGYVLKRALSPLPYWKVPLIGQYIDGCGWALSRMTKLLNSYVDQFEQKQHSLATTTTTTTTTNPENDAETVLEKMLGMLKKDDTKMKRDRMIGNLLTLFFAAIDTVSTSMSIALWKLAEDNTGLQDELAQEIIELGDSSELSLENMNSVLPRTRSHIFECIRVFSPSRTSFLETNKGATLGGVELPKGTKLMVMGQYASMHPEGNDTLDVPVGPNGEGNDQFCPRRWLTTDENGKLSVRQPTNSKGGYFSFGHGLRICPGKEFAEAEIAFVLAAVLQNFEISMKPNHDKITLVMNFVCSPDIDVELMLSPRRVEI